MPSAYDLITANESPVKVLKVLLESSPEEIQASARRLTNDEFDHVWDWTFLNVNAFGVALSLRYGGLLHCLRLATSHQDRQEAFKLMIERLEISPTRAYDSIAIFKSFGPHLLDNAELTKQFPVESLKLLSAANATDSAREAALAMARRGERVTIAAAKALLAEHSIVPYLLEGDEDDSDSSGREASTRLGGNATRGRSHKYRSYNGDALRIRVEIKKPQSAPEWELIKSDFERALAKFKEDLEPSDDEAPAEDASLETADV